MLKTFKNFVKEITKTVGEGPAAPELDPSDKKLAAAALMFHVIAADGIVKPRERERLSAVLCSHYDVSPADIEKLIEQASKADNDAVDLFSFTSVLKRQMSKDERILLVEDLWEMVFADDELHEFEDNIVWRVAELISVSPQDRILMKQRVQARYS